ncbi:hypothetical protein SAMD00019534_069560 [Acytostelium subglobosum LB1]|uniref:hypothetical protein n=1 Tax=Acytostelium subglobosum LB1 TaxID=1410327 RepID=UPI000644CAF7|nr:hypothetical protein SAMD00019534_069560 [Acytostelium subglobosum LB1]GAM23781.1 hypothetical protein SAMD00019534_069560 [Acytostelium subglobosum LB1]|eukprot:XP_012753522.1 hypothetical protein SAMD00019534_069560 [Acytostelium subglobosum LB1]
MKQSGELPTTTTTTTTTSTTTQSQTQTQISDQQLVNYLESFKHSLFEEYRNSVDVVAPTQQTQLDRIKLYEEQHVDQSLLANCQLLTNDLGAVVARVEQLSSDVPPIVNADTQQYLKKMDPSSNNININNINTTQQQQQQQQQQLSPGMSEKQVIQLLSHTTNEVELIQRSSVAVTEVMSDVISHCKEVSEAVSHIIST